ncbi:hypothetical protein L6V77_28160, partial [Myxococcota bacterium]|nr:hypothetical protein [Myxococcota bacterium]
MSDVRGFGWRRCVLVAGVSVALAGCGDDGSTSGAGPAKDAAGAGGLALDDGRIAELGGIETLRLKSYSTVDLYGATSFGANLKTLEIQ